jgi:VWFA-related protein
MVGLTDLSRRIFFRLLPHAFFLCILFSGADRCLAQEQQTPAIRVEVSRVNVGVIATDRDGNFVEGLKQGDFHIFDNGVEQPIAGFLTNDDPAQVILMIECGPSMYLFGKQSAQRADALIANLAPNDRVAIVCYSSEATIEYPLSENKAEARMALQELNFSIGSASLDLSRSLLTVFTWLNSVPGKKTVVLLGTGLDSEPPVSEELFRAYLSSVDIRVLAVSTSNQLVQAPKHHKRTKQERASATALEPMLKEGEATLRGLTAATGGRVYFPKSAKDFEKIYLEIAQIVRHEYNLAFVPQTQDGKLHTLRVTVEHAQRVNNRQAYLAPTAAAE